MDLAARCFGTLGTIAAKGFQPNIEIDVVATESALGQHGRNFGRGSAGAQTMRIDDHPRQPRRQRQRAQLSAFVGDPPLGVERAEFAQQLTRFL